MEFGDFSLKMFSVRASSWLGYGSHGLDFEAGPTSLQLEVCKRLPGISRHVWTWLCFPGTPQNRPSMYTTAGTMQFHWIVYPASLHDALERLSFSATKWTKIREREKHLQRGAKWFLNIVNSPSIHFDWHPFGGAGIYSLLCIFGGAPADS